MDAETYIKSKLDCTFMAYMPNDAVFCLKRVSPNFSPEYAALDRHAESYIHGSGHGTRKPLPGVDALEAACELIKSGSSGAFIAKELARRFGISEAKGDLTAKKAREILNVPRSPRHKRPKWE